MKLQKLFLEDSISTLEMNWIDAYSREKMASEYLKLLEDKLLNHPEVAKRTKVEGLHHLHRLNYTTGKINTWNQSALQELRTLVPNILWPFSETYKIRANDLSSYEIKYPNSWKKLRSVVKQTKTKPTFSFINKPTQADVQISDSVKTLSDLEQAWIDTKERIKLQRSIRLAAEQDILKKLDYSLFQGTVYLENIKITLKTQTKIDHEKLRELKKSIPSEEWLFSTHFKENKISSKDLKHNVPEIWSIISPALQTKPKKAQFTLAA